jgi:hypothetical protein
VGWRHALWLVVLVAASVGFSLGFACAVPFAAFGAAVAVTLGRREALYLTGALWLANQVIGFGVLNYPWDPSTFTWGVVLGVVAVLTTFAAQSIAGRLGEVGGVVIALATFAGAFVVYEGSLFAVSAAWLGGTEVFAPAIVVRILEINATAFGGLLVLNRLGGVVGLTARPAFP